MNNKYLFWNYINLQNKDRIFWKSEKKHYNFYVNLDKKLLHVYFTKNLVKDGQLYGNLAWQEESLFFKKQSAS